MSFNPDFSEMQSLSNFSLLHGASHPEELIFHAKELGYRALAISDYNSLAGIVRAHETADNLNFTFCIACRLQISYTPHLKSNTEEECFLDIIVYPTNRKSYGNLCRLLTIGKRRCETNTCKLSLPDFIQYQDDLVFTIVPPANIVNNTQSLNFIEACKVILNKDSAKQFGSISLCQTYNYKSYFYTRAVVESAEYLGLPLLATNDVRFHSPERRPLADVLTCIKHTCTVQQAGFLLSQNAERYLKSKKEIAHLFREFPQAIRRSVEISEMAKAFKLNELRYEYPHEILPSGLDALEYLSNLTWQGAKEHYPEGIPDKVKNLIEAELSLIHDLEYEKYFLTCYDIVKFAREREILCQGRGAAANSAVCFCLGITAVDPSKIDLLFARFISKERNEPPDIDIDFEHERREEVIQYIYQKYGRDRAGLTCEVVTYRHRSAIRDVGKALGISLDIVDKLAKSIHNWTSCKVSEEELREIGLNPLDMTIQNAFHLSKELLGFPRHLSQHVGGFIISEQPLCETVPILNAPMPDRTIIEWNKDDIDILGMLKIDVLGLGMLSCIRKGLELVNQRRKENEEDILALHSIPAEDPLVYDMICKADTIGVFQIESRAQMSMLPRLRPRCFYDLVIEVAIVRPGPIQGNMVHPYLKRRMGLEEPVYADQRVKDVLGKTLGVPLFQEQAMRLAIVLANFSPGEAERLRRAMAAWRRNKELIDSFKERIVQGMLANGYNLEFAETCISQMKGFSEYGFPESHAASFAVLVYASAWIKKYYPAEFTAALINSQPMGFYAPSQLIRDAEAHGVKILPIDVNKSLWDCTIEKIESQSGEEDFAIRLGMRLIKSLAKAQAEIINTAVKEHGEFFTISNLWLKAKTISSGAIRRQTLEFLARADAFESMKLSRREALWEIRALVEKPASLDKIISLPQGQIPNLPKLSIQQSMFEDYSTTGLSLKAHPLQFIREELNKKGVQCASTLRTKVLRKNSQILVSTAGIAIVRQRPGTAKGVVFITLEDETGITNLIIKPNIFEKYQKTIIMASCILAKGTLDRVGEVVYVSTTSMESLDSLILNTRRSPLPTKSYSY